MVLSDDVLQKYTMMYHKLLEAIRGEFPDPTDANKQLEDLLEWARQQPKIKLIGDTVFFNQALYKGFTIERYKSFIMYITIIFQINIII